MGQVQLNLLLFFALNQEASEAEPTLSLGFLAPSRESNSFRAKMSHAKTQRTLSEAMFT
jgi:hypothetical protein